MSESNILSEVESLLVDVESTLPEESKAAIIEEYNTDIPIETKAEQTRSTPLEASKIMGLNLEVDYSEVLERQRNNQDLYRIKNTADVPLIIDWDLNLMPEGLESDFDKFLSEQYVKFNLPLQNTGRIVVYQDSRSINFLHQFMNSKQYPHMLSRAVGNEYVTKSQFVIDSGESIIVSKKQMESLKGYGKFVRKIQIKDKIEESSPLGFLLIHPFEMGVHGNEINRITYTSPLFLDTAGRATADKKERSPISKSIGSYEMANE